MSTMIRSLTFFLLLATSSRALADPQAILSSAVRPSTVLAIELTPEALLFAQSLPTGESHESLAALIGLADGESVFLTIEIPYSLAQASVQLHVPTTVDDRELAAKLKEFGFPPVLKQTSCYSISPFTPWESDARVRIESDTQKHVGRFMEALQTQGDFPVRIAICAPEYFRRTLRETMPLLPGELYEIKTETLLDGAQWLSVGVDPKAFKLHAIADAKDTASAEAFAKIVPTVVKEIVALANSQDSLLGPLEPFLAALPSQLEVTNDAQRSHIQLSDAASTSGAAMLRIAKSLVKPVSERRVTQSLKEITLAFHNYESANGSFPPGKRARGEAGKPLLSWRVHILPYMDQLDLYNEFHLDEPWDSEHNIRLLGRMPEVYAPGIGAKQTIEPGHCIVQAPVGEKTIAGRDKPVRFQTITDGTSNTILLVVTTPELAVPWTKPVDYVVKPDSPSQGLAMDDDGSFAASFADGSVQRIPSSLGDAINALFSMNGGEVVDWRR